ncbi:MAG TPA: Crp/Fnr family transcriptional regulator [Burkholderiaceae bacterium]
MRAPVKTSTFLANIPMFSDATADDLEGLAAGTTELRVPKGQIIVQRGDPCVGFHVVVYGQVKLAFVSPNGAEKVIEIIGPGHSFGEALMFTDRPYVVFAQALADTMLLHIAKTAIDSAIERDPKLAMRMIAGLSRKLHGLVEDVEAYSLRSGMQRVIGYLLRDLEEEVEKGHDPVKIVLDANKGVIASRLNLSAEHFSRTLAELSHENLIQVDGARITIIDPARLREYLS